ncbi:MAG: DUF433 domain-containing protein [Blastocatellia bacterium]
MSTLTSTPLIVETPRGPSVAGTRITVYSVMDYIRAGRSRAYILQMLPLLNSEQLDAVFEYIEQHRAEVERAYAEILRRSEQMQAHSREVSRQRAPFTPDTPTEERRKILLKKLAEQSNAAQEDHEDHYPARS